MSVKRSKSAHLVAQHDVKEGKRRGRSKPWEVSKPSGIDGDIDIRLIKLSLGNIFPQWQCNQNFNIFHQLIEQVIPNFESVEFILAEILELQRYESKATTHVYSSFDAETNEVLINNYFKVIESFIESRGWSLSKLDNLYFGQRIWCGRLYSGEASRNPAGEGKLKGWYESNRDKKLNLNYEEKEERQETEIEEMLKEYMKELSSLCLKQYPYSYVLLIPISLNALEQYSEYKAKLGAIFLHFSTSKEIEELDLRRIYSRILLFWHYYFTSELMGKRQREIEQLKAVQDLFASVQQHTNSIRDILHKLQKPLLNLEMTLSPVCGLIYGGESLEPFFQSAGPPVKINDHMPPIKPAHDWDPQLAKTAAGLKVYQDLTAAILFKVLGLADSTVPGQTLWEQLCMLINQNIGGPKQSLITALVEYIPELRIDDPTSEQIRTAFKRVKAWFNDAYKVQNEDQASLPYLFLAMAMKSMNCSINFPETGDYSFWTASKRPIETIDALAVLHDMKTIKEAVLTKEGTDTHRLEILTEKSHEMNDNNALRLESSLQSTLMAYNSGDMPRRGNMTYVFLKLFGFRSIQRDGYKFSWGNGNRRRLSVFFDTTPADLNKISIEWVGKIFS